MKIISIFLSLMLSCSLLAANIKNTEDVSIDEVETSKKEQRAFNRFLLRLQGVAVTEFFGQQSSLEDEKSFDLYEQVKKAKDVLILFPYLQQIKERIDPNRRFDFQRKCIMLLANMAPAYYPYNLEQKLLKVEQQQLRKHRENLLLDELLENNLPQRNSGPYSIAFENLDNKREIYSLFNLGFDKECEKIMKQYHWIVYYDSIFRLYWEYLTLFPTTSEQIEVLLETLFSDYASSKQHPLFPTRLANDTNRKWISKALFYSHIISIGVGAEQVVSCLIKKLYKSKNPFLKNLRFLAYSRPLGKNPKGLMKVENLKRYKELSRYHKPFLSLLFTYFKLPPKQLAKFAKLNPVTECLLIATCLIFIVKSYSVYLNRELNFTLKSTLLPVLTGEYSPKELEYYLRFILLCAARANYSSSIPEGNNGRNVWRRICFMLDESCSHFHDEWNPSEARIGVDIIKRGVIKKISQALKLGLDNSKCSFDTYPNRRRLGKKDTYFSFFSD